MEGRAMLTQAAIRTRSFSQPAAHPPKKEAERGDYKAGTIEFMGTVMTFPRNAEIYGENEPAEYLYKVVSGTVRTYKVLIDGRRQIGSFYLAGDLFGLEAGDEHSFSAEAITACKVLVIKRSALLALAAR